MSYQLLKQDILFYQRFLKSNGFYNGDLDGMWGAITNKADADFVAQSNYLADQFGTYDKRSESNIITLVPKAQIQARKFLQISRDNNMDARIISGTRTYDEQEVLYSQGRNERPGQIITNAKGGQSNHNFGIAWDIGIFDNTGKYVTDDEKYISLSTIVLAILDSLEWGGNWHSFKDYPHYQLKAISEDVVLVRQLFEDGNVYV